MKAIVNHKKILFHLEKDEDEYPPDDWESLWAFNTGNELYSIDNIPFYIRGLSFGDIVSVSKKNGELFFEQIEKFSDHSVLRVIVFEKENNEDLRKSMSKFGCDFEGSNIEGFTAFDVPPIVNFNDVVRFLQEGENRRLWEYEEASVRHHT